MSTTGRLSDGRMTVSDEMCQSVRVPTSKNDPEGWSAADKFTVVLETAGLSVNELSADCR